MKQFFKFFKYLNENNTFYNFSLIFGFNEGIFKNDDYHISETQFIQRMQHLDIQWISEKITDPKDLAAHKEELHNFFIHLSNGFKNFYGEVCLKKVVERLESHLGLSLGHNKPGVHKTRTAKLGPTAKLAIK